MNAATRRALVIALVGDVVAKCDDSEAAGALERAMLVYLAAVAGVGDPVFHSPKASSGPEVAPSNTRSDTRREAVEPVVGVGGPGEGVLQTSQAMGDTPPRPAPLRTTPGNPEEARPTSSDDTIPSPMATVSPQDTGVSSEATTAVGSRRHGSPVLRRIIWVCVAAAVAGVAIGTWWWLQPKSLGDGFVSGNGRIEAVEIDVAAKSAGRVTDVLVEEGDFVSVGQVVAEMDASVLTAQKHEATARLEQAQSAVETAVSQVALRESERTAARAVVSQREAELHAARKRAARSETLSLEGATSIQELDDDRARVESASAAIAAARAQVAASDAAITTAQSQVLGSRASVLAVAATVDRLAADIDELTLRAPRDGRVQYRVTEAGEVVAAGGNVLNMIDVGDVYLTFFVAETVAGRVAIGSEVHIVLDAASQYVLPARVTYVASTAQFTPKTVETASERQKLMFRVKASIDRDLLQKHLTLVKTGLPGVAWLKLDANAAWPPSLEIKVPQ